MNLQSTKHYIDFNNWEEVTVKHLSTQLSSQGYSEEEIDSLIDNFLEGIEGGVISRELLDKHLQEWFNSDHRLAKPLYSLRNDPDFAVAMTNLQNQAKRGQDIDPYSATRYINSTAKQKLWDAEKKYN